MCYCLGSSFLDQIWGSDLLGLKEFEGAEADAKLSGMVLSPTEAPQNATAAVEARKPDRAEEHVAQAQEQLARVAQGQSTQAPPESTSTSQRERPSRDGFFGLLDKLDNVNSVQVITYICLQHLLGSRAPAQVECASLRSDPFGNRRCKYYCVMYRWVQWPGHFGGVPFCQCAQTIRFFMSCFYFPNIVWKLFLS